MMLGLLENGPSIRKIAGVLVSFKKITPMSRTATPDERLQKELERLALCAPHMLADIGFERDLKACSSEKAVWRRGTNCVIISSQKHAAAFI